MSHIRSAQNSPGTWAAISRCQRAQNVSAGSDSRHAACTLHPRCFPSPAACGYYCPHVRATLGWYALIQQPFSGLSRYRHPTISVWSHHFGIQNTQAWRNHPIQPSLLALELATSCPPLDHICQAPPPEPCGPAPLLTQRQACGRTWRSRSTPSLHVVAGDDASSPGSRCCLPRWYRRELVEGYPGHVSWSAERPAPALIAG